MLIFLKIIPPCFINSNWPLWIILSSMDIVFGIITQTGDRPVGSPVCVYIAFWFLMHQLNFNCPLCLNNSNREVNMKSKVLFLVVQIRDIAEKVTWHADARYTLIRTFTRKYLSHTVYILYDRWHALADLEGIEGPTPSSFVIKINIYIEKECKISFCCYLSFVLYVKSS